MENNFKLYKCYKGTCSKCLNEENPYLTEDEYKDLLDSDGKVQCPEGHLDCGIQELKPEDYPKQPKDNKKLFVLGGGLLVLILLIVGAVFLFTGKPKPVPGSVIIHVPEKVQPPASPKVEPEAAVPMPETKRVTVPEETSRPTKVASKISTTSSLEDYFKKIADKSIPYEDKDKLKNEVISNYFAADDAQVIEMGANNTLVSHTKVKDYMEELSQQFYQIKIVKSEANGENKITKLYIKEL